MRNIVFITADQLRWDALGFQNRFPVQTPTLDALANGGYCFENAYSANPLCVPARASIMTGRYCCDTGLYYNDGNWKPSLKTIPGELSRNNYYTVAVGKMHFRPTHANFGFDKRIADTYDYNGHLAARGHQPPKPPAGDGTIHNPARIEWVYGTERWDLPAEDYHTPWVTEAALSELERIDERRDLAPEANEPFFMWLSYVKPHVPCNPPEPYGSMYNPDDLPGPVRTEEEVDRFPRALARFKRHWDVLSDDTIRRLRARYLGDVTLIDEQIGRVIERLKEMGVWENTTVIFTSDHGDHLGDHWLQQKSFFFESSAKVPLIFYGPDVIGGGSSQENVSHIDLMPTLLEYCGLTMPADRDEVGNLLYDYADFGDAISLLPWLTGQTTESGRRVVVSESGVHGLHVMAKQGNDKYTYYADSGEFEYFNLEDDPEELDNHLGAYRWETLPEEVEATLTDVLARAKEHEGTTYRSASVLAPMFT